MIFEPISVQIFNRYRFKFGSPTVDLELVKGRARMVKSKALEDPFEHSRAAQKFEAKGDHEAAESAFRKAIQAADRLPMDEYRENLRVVTRELTKDRSSGIVAEALDIEAVTNAYHELIAMPFLTRVQLAGFYARRGDCNKARKHCNEAFDVGLEAETLRAPAVAVAEQRAVQLNNALNDIMGPADAERVFAELFARLDTNHDDYVDEEELRRALLDIEIDEEGHALVRFLLHNYEKVMQSAKDQLWFADYLGISKADLKNYQKKQKARFGRATQDG